MAVLAAITGWAASGGIGVSASFLESSLAGEGAPAPTAAQTPVPPNGWQAFTQGRYLVAIALAQAGNSADDAALACRAGLIVSSFPPQEADTPFTPADTLHTALQDCETALRRSPQHAEATVSYALALAAEGKRLKSVALVKKSRRILEQAASRTAGWQEAVENAPAQSPTVQSPTIPSQAHALALSALAGWHDAVASAGLLARIATGARSNTARTLYQDAYTALAASISGTQHTGESPQDAARRQDFLLSTHPQAQALIAKDMAIALEYAKFLARRKHSDQDEAAALLRLIAASPAQTAFDVQTQARAAVLADALQSGQARKVNSAVEAISPFETIADYKDTLSAYIPLCLPSIDPQEQAPDCRPQP